MPKKMEQGYGPFEQAIRIAYRPSRLVFTVLVCLHILAFFSIMQLEIFVWIRLLFAALVFIGFFKSYQDYLEQKNSYPGRELLLDTKDVWYLIDKRQATTELTLLPAVFAHPLLIVLRFSDERRKKYSFVLTQDNLDKDTLRRLQVRLRFNSGVRNRQLIP